MQPPKSYLTSKTLWANVLMFLAGLAALLLDLPVVAENPKAVAIISVVVIPTINSVLRLITNKPVAVKGNLNWS